MAGSNWIFDNPDHARYPDLPAFPDPFTGLFLAAANEISARSMSSKDFRLPRPSIGSH